MPKDNFKARAIRELAEEVVDQLVDQGQIDVLVRPDLVTSLVRQWITHQGRATLFLGPRQFYLTLEPTPLGKLYPQIEPGLSDWGLSLTDDWKVDPDDLADVFAQLNVGQSAEVINRDGVPLRMRVDPSARVQAVEPLVKEERTANASRDYRKIARSCLQQQFGDSLDLEEVEALACSVAAQWKRFQGAAVLFVGQEQLWFSFAEIGEANCRVDAGRELTDIRRQLIAFGCPTETIPEAICRLNLAQQLSFRDSHGYPTAIWYDPRTRNLVAAPLPPTPVPSRVVSPPIFCPKCSAVLTPWRAGQSQQACPKCAQLIVINRVA